MPNVSFASLVVVAAIAVAAPLLVGLVPRFRVPAVVLEIVAGIIVGPHGLKLVKRIDEPVQILALVGLAFLLFLAGLEIDVERLRGGHRAEPRGRRRDRRRNCRQRVRGDRRARVLRPGTRDPGQSRVPGAA